MTSNLKDIGIALLRVSLGVMFIAHGLLKVVVFGLPGTVAFFESVGLPGLLAYLTVVAEILGGGFLVLGIWTRSVAIGLLPILIGALVVHWSNGWVFSNANGGWEYPLFLALASVALALQGSGAWTVAPRNRPAPLAAGNPATCRQS